MLIQQWEDQSCFPRCWKLARFKGRLYYHGNNRKDSIQQLITKLIGIESRVHNCLLEGFNKWATSASERIVNLERWVLHWTADCWRLFQLYAVVVVRTPFQAWRIICWRIFVFSQCTCMSVRWTHFVWFRNVDLLKQNKKLQLHLQVNGYFLFYD